MNGGNFKPYGSLTCAIHKETYSLEAIPRDAQKKLTVDSRNIYDIYHKNTVYFLYKYCKNAVFHKGLCMGRPAGVKNKTPQELKVDAEMLMKKAEMQELERKRRELAKQRQMGVKNGK